MQPAAAQLHYITDNLNTHFHNDFCQAVAELSHEKYSPLEKGTQRREWLQRDDKRIVIYFTPFHGSWLNMIKIWFGILNQKCLKLKGFEDIIRLQKAILDFMATWNSYFAHPFTWTYKGDGLHEKVVSRFNKLLQIETTQISFLNKQCMLMVNIAKEYHEIIQTQQWAQLCELVTAKNRYLQNIIIKSPKEKLKKTTHHNLENLTKILYCQN